MIGRNEIGRMLAAALDALRKAGADQGHAECVCGAIALTRFADNRIHQNVAEEGARVSMIAAAGRKLGGAATNRTDAKGFADAAERAVTIAKRQADDPDFPGFKEWPEASELPEAFDAETAGMSADSRARIAQRAAEYAKARDVAAYGAVKTGGGELAVANTSGTFQYFAGSSIGASCTGMIAGAAGSEGHGARAISIIGDSVAKFGMLAVDTALKAREPKECGDGEWPVVLSPRAVGELLRFLSWLGFNARSHQEGRSCLCGKLGQKIMSDLVTVIDDGLSLDGQPLPFDSEGAPRRRLTLIEKGVPRELAHDSRTAEKAGIASTGHSYGPMSYGGASPQHLFMLPGNATVDEMIASTERGLYVSRFWYTNVAEPAKGVLTGMTRDGLFLIEKGEVRHPVRNMRFTESVVEALNRVEMVGSVLANAGDEWGSGVTRCPALKMSAFRFSGATKF
ncbi:MAG TPA: TldD/PmbA family protein [Candidatus Brocadiia bacterium]|nr:TldD/PmbA family protein [Candidatus Brocadiia bacterium]